MWVGEARKLMKWSRYWVHVRTQFVVGRPDSWPADRSSSAAFPQTHASRSSLTAPIPWPAARSAHGRCVVARRSNYNRMGTLAAAKSPPPQSNLNLDIIRLLTSTAGIRTVAGG